MTWKFPASVQAIGRAGAGTNNIPIADMSKRGVVVFNTPGANANAVKELVLAGILMAARNIGPAMKFVSGLEGDDATLSVTVEDGKKNFVGIEIPGQYARHRWFGCSRRHGGRYGVETWHESVGLRPGNHCGCGLALVF